jgi:hypothetical protein
LFFLMVFYVLRDGVTAPYIVADESLAWQSFKNVDDLIQHMLDHPDEQFQTAAYAPRSRVQLPPGPLPSDRWLAAGEQDNRPWLTLYEQGPETPLMPIQLLNVYRPLEKADLLKISERTAHLYKGKVA